jgi:hypothetical protein
MTRWAVGGTVLLAAAAVVAWYGVQQTGPEVVVNAPVTPAPPPAVPPPPAAPAPLARVVDVADIDPLLDPPTTPAAGVTPTGPILIAVGYEEPAPAPAPAGDVTPIPPAVEYGDGDADGDDRVEVAPPPRARPTPAALLVPTPAELVRAGWYGEAWLTDAGPQDHWYEWPPLVPDFDDPCRPARLGIFPGVVVSAGLFF